MIKIYNNQYSLPFPLATDFQLEGGGADISKLTFQRRQLTDRHNPSDTETETETDFRTKSG